MLQRSVGRILALLGGLGLAGCDGGAVAPVVELAPQALTLGTFAVKPVADTLTSAVAGVGDTTALWKNVDDGTAYTSSDNDTTYVRSTSDTAAHGVRFSGGKAGTVSQVVVHYRARVANATGTIEVELRDGNEAVGTGPQHLLTTSWANFTETFSGLAVVDLARLSTSFTLRRRSGTGDVRYTMVWIEATLHPISHTVAALLYTDIDTCVVGDPCSGAECTGLWDDQQTLIEGFQRSNFRSVSPDDPLCTTAAKHKRVRLTMPPDQVLERRHQLDVYRANVFRWSNGELNLRIDVQEIGTTKMGLADWGGGLWIGPGEIEAKGRRAVSRFTDFTIVSQGVRDATLGLHHGLGGCGGTIGADGGVGGAGHSWIPYTGNAYWFECSEESVYTHEWLHQTHWALNNLSNFTDLYHESFPACGMGNSDPTRWFPDTHSCNADPDAPYCGMAECGSNDVVNSHVLGEHWKAGRILTANHCRNGVLDYGETAIDVGPECPAVVNRTPTASRVTASGDDGNGPGNAVDNNLGTRWSASGANVWLRFDLGTTRRVTHVGLAVYQGDTRRNDFDLQVSSDGTTWTTVWTGLSSGTTTAQEVLDFPDVDARYVRYLGRGNYSANGTFAAWSSVTEVDIFAQ
jgi:hypothetical protein